MTLLSSAIASAQSPRSLTLVLLVGEMNGPTVSEDVPMTARKALAELRTLLPFKSYRLYDNGVIGMPSETLPAVTRLRGASVKGQEPPLFEVSVVQPKFSQALDVSLREIGPTEPPKPTAADAPAANVMAASVRVRAGETVVVGASRVRGDKALVLLITGMSTSLGSSESTRGPAPGTFFRGVQPPQPGQPQIQPPQPAKQPPQPSVQPVPPGAPQAAPPARPLTGAPAAPATPPLAPLPSAPIPAPSRSPE
jgi:hypothetical protein